MERLRSLHRRAVQLGEAVVNIIGVQLMTAFRDHYSTVGTLRPSP